MKITVICVGKLKEQYLREAVQEYAKRLGRFARLQIIEVADEKAPENLSPAQEKAIRAKEGEKIAGKIPTGDLVVALAIDGRQFTSEELAGFIQEKMTGGVSGITFLIGGSLGLWESLLQQSDCRLSFSKMTFPHQLMRVILLEQIYRCFKISHHEPYHK